VAEASLGAKEKKEKKKKNCEGFGPWGWFPPWGWLKGTTPKGQNPYILFYFFGH
jgi:hypothetical protein